MTLIELLVTIIIAGIFFAALIPFLVSAQSQTANENMRNIALQIARDKIESIHQLNYSSVTDAYLTDNGPPDGSGQFGTQWVENGGTSSKTFYIGYDVTDVPATTTTGSYKLVSVSVSWDGAPKPNFTDYSGPTPVPASNNPIVLQTQVSPQYFGPQIVNLTSPAAAADPSDPNNPVYVITAGGSVPLIATVATSDLTQMPGGQVVFSVTDMNGSAVASGAASAPIASGSNEYEWDWDSGDVSSGYYMFSAYAETASQAAGNTWSVTYNVRAARLPAPEELTATAYNGSVNLKWGAVSGAGHYRVYRSTASGSETLLVDGVVPTTYLDTSVTNGTTYYYTVCAVDSSGTEGISSSEVSCTPVESPDTTAPTAPSNLTLSQATATGIAFTWTDSKDPGGTGVVEYQVWRSPDGSAGSYVEIGTVLGTQANPPVAQYTDFGLDPGTTYYYEVYAIDGNNNVSGSSPTASFSTTNTTPTGTLTVQNKSQGNTKISVSVYNLSSEEWYDTTGKVWTTAFWTLIENSGGAKTSWVQLPAGTAFGAYQVTATADGQTIQQQTVTVSDGKTTTISFKF